jgi:Glycosyl hydrolases family 16
MSSAPGPARARPGAWAPQSTLRRSDCSVQDRRSEETVRLLRVRRRPSRRSSSTSVRTSPRSSTSRSSTTPAVASCFSTYSAGGQTNTVTKQLPFDPTADFHEYAIEYDAGGVSFLADGVPMQSWSSGVPRSSMYLLRERVVPLLAGRREAVHRSVHGRRSGRAHRAVARGGPSSAHSSSTARMLPAGSVNQAMGGPPSAREIPFSSCPKPS